MNDTRDYKQIWGETLTPRAGNVESGALNYEETAGEYLLLAGD